jgi:hypothetical protein
MLHTKNIILLHTKNKFSRINEIIQLVTEQEPERSDIIKALKKCSYRDGPVVIIINSIYRQIVINGQVSRLRKLLRWNMSV